MAPELIVQLDLRGARQTHVTESYPRSRAVVDGIEREHARSAERLVEPVPGEADVLWRINGKHTADGLRISQSNAQLAADPGVKLGRVEPLAQTVGRREEREDERARRVDLGLQLDSIVHSAGPSACGRCGRNLNQAQKATDARPKMINNAIRVKNEVRVESAR